MVESPWALFPYITPNSSYNQAVEVPASGPDVGPFVCAHIPVVWMPYVLGALAQWRMPIAWQVTTEAEISSIMAWVDELIGTIADASMCDERGSLSLTIGVGSATASSVVTFPVAFTTVPDVVCSSDSPDVTASYESVSMTGFTARITRATPLSTTLTADYSWDAGPAT